MTTIHQYKEERKKEFDTKYPHGSFHVEPEDRNSLKSFLSATIDGVLERVREMVGDVPQDYLTTYAGRTLGKYEERTRIRTRIDEAKKQLSTE